MVEERKGALVVGYLPVGSGNRGGVMIGGIGARVVPLNSLPGAEVAPPSVVESTTPDVV